MKSHVVERLFFTLWLIAACVLLGIEFGWKVGLGIYMVASYLTDKPIVIGKD